MRYGTNKEKHTKLGAGLIKMTGKGEPWHTKEEDLSQNVVICTFEGCLFGAVVRLC